MKNNKLENLLLVFALAIFIFLLYQAVNQTGFTWVIDFDFAKKFGAALAGILSFVSVVIIFINLRKQSYSFVITQTENRVFELIKFHRENVQEMEYETPKSTDEKQIVTYKGHKVFVSIFNEISLSLNYLNDFLINYGKPFDSTYKTEEIKEQRKNKFHFDDRKFTFEELEKINIAYLIVFVGVSTQGIQVLRNILEQYYNEEFIDKLVKCYTSIPVCWSKHRKTFEEGKEIKEGKKYVKYFGGHQYRLGHYFRHLYQTITYIDDSKDLNFDQKYGYIKKLRAQLSTFEQAIIFFNSLSEFGRVWEFEKSHYNNQLITKYNLIKNIPAEFITDFGLEKFYPLVKYEGSIEKEEKKALRKKYT